MEVGKPLSSIFYVWTKMVQSSKLIFIFTITCSFKKCIEITYCPPKFCRHQHFFPQKSAKLNRDWWWITLVSRTTQTRIYPCLKTKLHSFQQFLCVCEVSKAFCIQIEKNILSNNVLLLILIFNVLPTSPLHVTSHENIKNWI